MQGKAVLGPKRSSLLTDGGSIILTAPLRVQRTPAFGGLRSDKAAIRCCARLDRGTQVTVVSIKRLSLVDRHTPLISSLRTLSRGLCPPLRWDAWETRRNRQVWLCFLTSDDSSFVTGIELFVDGAGHKSNQLL